jgi:hypothetical protein
MPFIKSKIKLTLVGEGRRGCLNEAGCAVDSQNLLRKAGCGFVFEKTSLVGEEGQRNMNGPAVYKFLPDIVRNEEGCVLPDETGYESWSLPRRCRRVWGWKYCIRNWQCITRDVLRNQW